MDILRYVLPIPALPIVVLLLIVFIALVVSRTQLGKLRRANRRLSRLLASIPPDVESLFFPPSRT